MDTEDEDDGKDRGFFGKHDDSDGGEVWIQDKGRMGFER